MTAHGVALLFPGQGSQEVGMGLALAEAHPAAKAVFARADEALGAPLSRLCASGPEDELRRTENTQPALLTAGIAALEALRAAGASFEPVALLGHSLGEWTALVAGGAIAFEDAVRLVRTRGRLMQSAVPEGEGAMAAVLGLDPARIAEVLAAVEGAVDVANLNAPEQTVISGHKAAVEAAGVRLKAAGAKRILPLPVSAPFHSRLMAPAAAGLAEALAGIAVGAPRAPVLANVDASEHPGGDATKRLLIEQVTRPVQFLRCAEGLAARGVTVGLELGPGRVLAGLVKRINGLKVHSVGDPAGLDEALAALG